MNDLMFNGMFIVITPGSQKQNRTHRKKRINKKWAKRYGFTYYDMIDYGKTMIFGGKVYMSQRTYDSMYTCLQKEGMVR